MVIIIKLFKFFIIFIISQQMLTSVTWLTTSARLTPIALTVGAPSHAGVGTATRTSPQAAQEVYAELTDLVNLLFF